MPNTDVDVVELGLTSADHVACPEFHGLGALLAELSGDDDFATLGLVPHNSLDDRVGRKSNWNLLEELKLQVLDLSRSAQTLELDGVEVDDDGALDVVEPLLDEVGQLTEPAAVGTVCLLDLGDLDDDLCLNWGHSDVDSSISGGSQRSLEELMELSVEHTIGNELSI